MYDTKRTREQILTMLAAGPSRIADLTKGLAPAQLVAFPAPGEWSARDVLGHLRACADMWGRSIRMILNEDKPTFKAVNPTNWIKQTNYLEMEFQPSLQAFTQQRIELLNLLESLATEDWYRTAMATGAGKPLERTVHTYAQWLANHEQAHYRQIGQIANVMRIVH